jgi:hypothetical protein
LCWGRELGRIVPVELLSELEEPRAVTQVEQEFKVIEGTCGLATIPGATDIENEIPSGLENAVNLLRKREKPV